MSSYPMKAESFSMNHKGGTKSYHLMWIVANNGKSIVIYRWGKTGITGQLKVEKFDRAADARKAFDSKSREKSSGGYIVDGATDRNMTIYDDADITRFIGRIQMSMVGSDAIKHLDPLFDTAAMGLRDAPKDVEYDEEGRKLDAAKRAAFDKAQMEAQKKAEEDARAAQMAAIPNFGRF